MRFSSDPREDVLRRDFTINGMLLDPVADLTRTAGRDIALTLRAADGAALARAGNPTAADIGDTLGVDRRLDPFASLIGPALEVRVEEPRSMALQPLQDRVERKLAHSLRLALPATAPQAGFACRRPGATSRDDCKVDEPRCRRADDGSRRADDGES